MKQIISDFIAIMADKKERREFIVGLVCVILAVVEIYYLVLIFH